MQSHDGSLEEMEKFAVLCGQTGPVRLRIENGRTGTSEDYDFRLPSIIIGSAESNTITLPDAEVSRRHAYLQVIDGRLACFDLDSRTGVHFRKRERSRDWLDPDESIRIGPYTVTLLAPVGAESTRFSKFPPKFSTWDAIDTASFPTVLAFLNAQSRSGTKRVCRIVRRVTLAGSSDVCNLRLQHTSVERVQCAVIAIADRLWLVNLAPGLGVVWNERATELTELSIDDQIQLGRFMLKVSSTHEVNELNRATSDRSARPSVGSKFPPRTVETAGGLVPRSVFPPPNPYQQLVPAPQTDATSLVMMQHFQAMQQQYMDHTQQMMSMVVQAFSSAHTRQLDVIREELQRVHELNRELQELQVRRDGSQVVSSEGESETASGQPNPAPASETLTGSPAPVQSAPGGVGQFSPGVFPPGVFPPGMFPPGMLPPGMMPPGMMPAGAVPGAIPIPLPPFPGMPGAAFPMGMPAPPGPRIPLPRAAKRQMEPAASPIQHGGSAGSTPATPSQNGAATSAVRPDRIPPIDPMAPSVPPGEEKTEVHFDVSDRINQLEKERTSRWSRILQLLSPGSGS